MNFDEESFEIVPVLEIICDSTLKPDEFINKKCVKVKVRSIFEGSSLRLPKAPLLDNGLSIIVKPMSSDKFDLLDNDRNILYNFIPPKRERFVVNGVCFGWICNEYQFKLYLKYNGSNGGKWEVEKLEPRINEKTKKFFRERYGIEVTVGDVLKNCYP